jgi:hypothetical protein
LILPQVITATNGLNPSPTNPVYVTGHSKGGEMAPIAAYLMQQGSGISIKQPGKPVSKAIVPRGDRNSIHIHYLPARRDPSDHISYTAGSLIGRLLRAADWAAAKENIKGFTKEIGECLGANASVTLLSKMIDVAWKELHRGTFFTAPEVSFVESESKGLEFDSVCDSWGRERDILGKTGGRTLRFLRRRISCQRPACHDIRRAS